MESDALPDSGSLSAEDAAGLVRRQTALQTEARTLLAQWSLFQHLQRVGRTALIGSAALGLMVWRDIDIMVVAPGLPAIRAFTALSPLLSDPRVQQLRYLNQRGPGTTTELTENDRYYFAALWQRDAEPEWKIDISFWLSDRPRHEMAYMDAMRQRLSDESRVAILWIKHAWYRRPAYRTSVLSIDIYRCRAGTWGTHT